MNLLNLNVITEGHLIPWEFEVKRMINAGYVGTDRKAVNAHIEELRKEGVLPPPSVPMVFPVLSHNVTTENQIEVIGDNTSGEVEFALSTRVDPSKDVMIINNARIWPFDPSATPVTGAFPHIEETRLPSLVGKWGIDATKPVPYRSAELKNFERAWPIAWGEVKLEDYLE